MPYTCACFYHWSTRPWTVYNFLLRLWAQPFLVLVGEAASPPICLHSPSGTVSIWTFFVFVLQGTPHLGYFLALASQPCTIWKFPWVLCSVLESPFPYQCLQLFRRGFRSDQQLFSDSYRAIWIFCPVWSPWGYCSCIQVFDRLTSRLAELPWDLDCPSVSCDDRGSEISWLGLLWSCKKRPGKSDTCLPFHHIVTEKVSTGCFHSLQNDCFVAVFTNVQWGGEDKMEAILFFLNGIYVLMACAQ